MSRQIYEQLGVEGLESRTSPEWDRRTVDRVKSMLAATSIERILDAGCGYGRIGIPLAAAGYSVVGIDVSPMMLAEAQRRARVAGVVVDWQLGDFCRLPYPDRSFDVVLCMWLTFNELLQEDDQIEALREMHRVLRPGGWALLDGPPYMEDVGETDEVDMSEYAAQASQSSAFTTVPMDQCSVGQRFSNLMDRVDVTRYELMVDDCPGKLRYFMRFWKCDPNALASGVSIEDID